MKIVEEKGTKSLRAAVRCEDGAIVVFGIFFAVLVLGMLYYFVGIAASIYYHERLQDAADASAFASAIVHARGMNTMALINMVMAAVLSVLVTLRLIEALIIVAEVLLYALSWLGGATAAAASALEVVRQEVSAIAEEVQPIIENVLKVLHVAGDVVRIITPIGSNAGVLTQVRENYEPEAMLAVALPARLTLPVEDDEYSYLCEKAGIMAVSLAMLPLSPLLPSFIEDPVVEAMGSLIGAGSSWFCGGDDAPPSVDVQPEAPKFPTTSEQQACMGEDKQNEDSIANCKAAEQFDAFSSPDPETGKCRLNQTACMPLKDEDEVIPPHPNSWCGSEGVGLMVGPEHCATEEAPDGRTVPSAETPYGKRLKMAREQCVPDGKLSKFGWEERVLQVSWQRDAKGNWVEVGEPVVVEPERYYAPDKAPRSQPCQIAYDGLLGYAGEQQFWPSSEWNTGSLTEPVCAIDEPKSDDPLVKTATTTRIEVTQVMTCSGEKPGKFSQQVAPVNISQDKMQGGASGIAPKPGSDVGGAWRDIQLNPGDPGASSAGGGSDALGGMGGAGGMDAAGGAGAQNGAGQNGAGQNGQGGDSGDNMNPFRFIDGHLLGTSDMQIRSLVLGVGLDDEDLNKDGVEMPDENGTTHTHAKRVVMMTKWGANSDELEALEKGAAVWGRFTVAQAEYYFDTSAPKDRFADWSEGKNGARDYLWYMGWTARMRRFRLSWEVDGKSADGESVNDSQNGNSGADNQMVEQMGGDVGSVNPETLLQNGPSADCGGSSDCQGASSMLPSFDGLFLH